VNDTLVGAIKHEHYVSSNAFVKIINPYLSVFGEAYRNWYGKNITQATILMSWVNFMRAGEFNPPHIHTNSDLSRSESTQRPNCDLSSVLFIKVPEGLKEENKKFPGTGSGPGTLSFSFGEFQPHNISTRVFFPEEGDLFIFPATLTHFVAPFRSEGERISMSANFRLD
jgi:hypothetical protein